MQIRNDATSKHHIALTLYRFVKATDYAVEDNNYVALALYLSEKCGCEVGDKYVEYLMKEVILKIDSQYTAQLSDDEFLGLIHRHMNSSRKTETRRRSYHMPRNFRAIIDVLSNPQNKVSDSDLVNVLKRYNSMNKLLNDAAFNYLNTNWSNDFAMQFVTLIEKNVVFTKDIDEIKKLREHDAVASKMDISECLIKFVESSRYPIDRIKGEDFVDTLMLYLWWTCHAIVSYRFVLYLLYRGWKLEMFNIERVNNFSDISYFITLNNYRERAADLLIKGYEGDYLDQTVDANYRYKVSSFLFDLGCHYQAENFYERFPSVIAHPFFYDKEVSLDKIKGHLYDELGSFQLSKNVIDFIACARSERFPKQEPSNYCIEETLSAIERKHEIIRELKEEFKKEKAEELRRIDATYCSAYLDWLSTQLSQRHGENSISIEWRYYTFDYPLCEAYLDDQSFSFEISSFVAITFDDITDNTVPSYLLAHGFQPMDERSTTLIYPSFETLHIRGIIQYGSDVNFMEVRFAVMNQGLKITDTHLQKRKIEVECSIEEYQALIISDQFAISDNGNRRGCYYVGEQTEQSQQ